MFRILIPLFFVLQTAFLANHAAAQAPLNDAQKRVAAEQAKQIISDFSIYFGNQVVPPGPQSIPEERAKARKEMVSCLRPDAVFVNDFVPGSTGTRKLNFQEFFNRLTTIDYPKGLESYDIDLSEVRFANDVPYTAGMGYFMLVYGQRSFAGTDRTGRFNRITTPCRIGVYITMKGMTVLNCQIGFIDAEPAPASGTFSPAEGNPADFVTLDDSMAELVQALSTGIAQNATRKITLETLSYDDKGVLNDFSQLVTLTLRDQLRQANKGIVIEAPTRSWAQELMTVKGFYRKEGNNLNLYAQLYDRNNQPVGSQAKAQIQLKNIPALQQDPTVLIPPDVPVATDIRKKLVNPTPLSNPGKLTFALRTNKGTHSLVYHNNDTMTVYVKANQPCNVRLIYRDAADSLILLRNQDFQVRADQVNQWVAVAAEGVNLGNKPAQFICYGPPFGAEFLIGYASNGTFGNLTTSRIEVGKDEYVTFILDDLDRVKKRSTARTIKLVGGGGGNQESSVVENVLQITTLKN